MNSTGRSLALFVPASLLAGLVAMAMGQENPRLSVCRHASADGRDARPVDLGRVDREYSAAAKAFRERMKAVEERTVAAKFSGHDAGLRGCARAERRVVSLREALPRAFFGRRVYYLASGPGGSVPPGIRAPLEPDAIVFLSGFSSTEEAGRLAERLKTSVTAGTQALAERLGIRCVGTVIDVSQDGMTLTIQELPR